MNVVWVRLTQLCKCKICVTHYKAIFNVLVTRIVTNFASCVNHFHYTLHEQKHKR